MKLRVNFYFLIILMASMLVIIGLSLTMAAFKSKLLPIMISSTVLVLAAIGLKQEISARDKPESATAADKEEESGAEDTEKGLRSYLPVWAWLIGFALAIYLLGFLVAMPLFVLAYMKKNGIGWLMAIISAILTSVFVYGVFELALSVELYRGLLFTWLIG